ncbi:MAG: hypothetical protein R3A45_09340 [Bdellovibrionota bacterium]
MNRKKDTVLTDFVRFSWKATRGLIDNPEEHMPYWNDRLGRTGKLTNDQVGLLSEFISTRTSDAHARFMSNVNESILEAVNKIADLTQQELSTIEQKLDQIEQKIAKF